MLLVFSSFFIKTSFSQTFPSSCTSKDLELVSASLTGDACLNCTSGEVTRTLTLGINNKTGSTRPAFAFWATLEITSTNSDGSTTVTRTSIQRCAGPIPPTGPLPAAYTGGDFGTITFNCGESLRLVDLHLAWTDAGKGVKNSCDYVLSHSETINPKCGVLPAIVINTGVNGSLASTNISCAGNDGAINLTPSGGTAPYTYAWSASGGGAIPAGQADDQDLTGLTAGTYNCTITDALNCTIQKGSTLTSASIPEPAATVTQQPTCTVTTGTVTVTGADANTTYTLNQNGNVIYTASNGAFGAVATGSYTLHASKGQCTATGNTVAVDAQPSTPTFTVCIVQPTLCANSGSITMTASGGSNFTYQLNASTAQPGNTFNNLASGSLTSIRVANGAGCSRTVLCADLVISCPQPESGGKAPSQTYQTIEKQIVVEDQTTVKAYPNPFGDNVRFVVSSSVAGRGSLEVFNMLGQKVKTVYQGQIIAGNQIFQMKLPSNRSNLIYVLRVGDKKITGKLLQINR